MIRRFLIIALAGLCGAGALYDISDAANFIEKPEKIEISGTVGLEFHRTLEIMAKDNITELYILPSDLTEQGGEDVILSDKVDIQPVQPAALNKHAFRRFSLTVQSPSSPGTYSGTLKVRFIHANNLMTENLPLTVKVKAVPTPRLVLSQPSKLVIKTTHGCKKEKEEKEEPVEAVTPQSSSKLDSKKTHGCKGQSRNFTVHEADGHTSADSLNVLIQDLLTEDLTATVPKTHIVPTAIGPPIKKGDYGTGTLEFRELDQINAGKYVGKAIIRSSNANDVDIPIEVYIKDSWLMPLLVLFSGIVLGLVLNWWETQGRKEADFEDRMERIENQLGGDAELNQKEGAAILPLLKLARIKLSRNDTTGAEEELKNAEQKIDKFYKDKAGGGKEEVTTFSLRESIQKPGVWEDSRSVRLKIMRIVIPVIFVGLALYIGWGTIYLTNDTFGATKGNGDYLGLFGWGFGVELTRSKLTDVLKRK